MHHTHRRRGYSCPFVVSKKGQGGGRPGLESGAHSSFLVGPCPNVAVCDHAWCVGETPESQPRWGRPFVPPPRPGALCLPGSFVWRAGERLGTTHLRGGRGAREPTLGPGPALHGLGSLARSGHSASRPLTRTSSRPARGLLAPSAAVPPCHAQQAQLACGPHAAARARAALSRLTPLPAAPSLRSGHRDPARSRHGPPRRRAGPHTPGHPERARAAGRASRTHPARTRRTPRELGVSFP